ncbi:MAG: hypothetical protein IT170_01640 [Bryobacterales bacterium]|nr:hypothetical protein [Bryobacterales bacterium]
MRLRSIFAAMMLLLTSVLGVCPACDRAHLADAAAQTANAPVSGHACCEHTQPAESGTNTAPESGSRPPAERCSHETASVMLESASPDHAVVLDMAAAALPSMVTLAGQVPTVSTGEWQAVADPSPPLLLALPIRI